VDFQFTSFLIGVSLALFIRNIIDYYYNSSHTSSDVMGAMINWHYGFLLSWFFLSIALGLTSGVKWYFGVAMLLSAPLTTYIFWFITDKTLEILKFIRA